MYLNCRVKIPDTGGKITSKTIGGTRYVYYEHTRVYNKKKQYSEPKRTCIGKRDPEHPAFLYPNEKFLKYFTRELLPSEKEGEFRSGCLHVGAYLVIRKIVSDYMRGRFEIKISYFTEMDSTRIWKSLRG